MSLENCYSTHANLLVGWNWLTRRTGPQRHLRQHRRPRRRSQRRQDCVQDVQDGPETEGVLTDARRGEDIPEEARKEQPAAEVVPRLRVLRSRGQYSGSEAH